MTPGARLAAAIEILDEIIAGAPVERAITKWSRASRFAGSKDRAAVRDTIYDVIRRRRSALWASGAATETGRALVLGLLHLTDRPMLEVFDGARHSPAPLTPDEARRLAEGRGSAPAPVAGDYPDFLHDELCRSLGPDLPRIAEVLKTRAPVDLRVNTLRATANQARAALAVEGFETSVVADVPSALRVAGNARGVGATQTFRRGMVELQDAASQAVAFMAGARPGQSVLDLCAGGGGKTLALAALMRNTGQLAAYDANPRRMKDLPGRAARAGAEIEVLGDAVVDRSGPYDLVLVDAPCSGTGAWRRDPAQKWRLTAEGLTALNALQDEVLARGARLVKPGGRLTYATCSILRSENEDRTAAFLSTCPNATMDLETRLLPGEVGDGFYIASFTFG